MDSRQFFDKVVEMREAQKAYFASRDYRALDKARKIEAEIDREIKRVKDILARQERDRLQKSLFADFDTELLNRQEDANNP